MLMKQYDPNFGPPLGATLVWLYIVTLQKKEDERGNGGLCRMSHMQFEHLYAL